METTSFLSFRLSGSLYAVEATAVLEIVPIPVISRLNETPAFLAGIANLRGRLVPVLDLNVHFGQPWRGYRMEQSVVFMERSGQAIGVIVDSAERVFAFARNEVTSPVQFGQEGAPSGTRFIEGIVESDQEIVMLLDLENLLALTDTLDSHDEGRDVSVLCRSPEDGATYQERSQKLAQPQAVEEAEGLLSLAIVRIGTELFGMELATIREFAELRNVTPIPCCPEHVVGQINLRGELLTVFDLSGVLGISRTQKSARRSVVLMNDPSLAGGVLVDELVDVLYLDRLDLKPIPHALRDDDHDHLLGAAMYGTRMFGLIDVPALMKHGELTVNGIP